MRGFFFFLEIGCGTGYVLRGISDAFPAAQLAGCEIFTNGLKYAKVKIPDVYLFQMDATKIPFVSEFDTIGAFDVLEHIKEDEIVLGQIHKALKNDGYLILTVPQHMWLWSAVDEYACHFRRYAAKELKQKLERNGFEIIKSTSFVTTLVPLMFLSRMFNKKSSEEGASSEFNLPPLVNGLLKLFLSFDFFLINLGINFPIGGSRIVIARKA